MSNIKELWQYPLLRWVCLWFPFLVAPYLLMPAKGMQGDFDVIH